MNFPLCPRFQAVLFDMDGTLLDTLSDMQDAVNHILLENGWPQRTLEEIRAFVGNGAAKLMERAIPEPIAPQRFQEILSTYKDWYQAHNCVKTAPYPGIPEVLAELEKMGVKTAVVSNKPDGPQRRSAADRRQLGVPRPRETGNCRCGTHRGHRPAAAGNAVQIAPSDKIFA